MDKRPAASDAVAIRDDVVYRDVDGAVVALSIATGEYAAFDEVGSRIWRLIEQYGHLVPITLALLAEYELDETTCEAEVREFVSMLEEKGLVSCAFS